MEKLKILKKKAKNGEGEWTSAFAGESKVNAELKKLTNSPGWVAATKKILPSSKSPANSRASTPVSTSSKGSRKLKKKKKNEIEKKKKKFKMVLEKDEEFEVDYVSPEEEENTEDSDSQSKAGNSDESDEDFSLGPEEDPEDDLSSLENGSIHLDEDFSETEMDEDVPSLELPESSKDLLIANNVVLKALGIYEALRHFRSLLRLSPMLFEDFCAALADENTNILLTECYISVLKAILREEDAAGVQFGPPDQKDSKDSALNFLDHMTWPEVVRAYLESTGEHSEVLKVVKHPKFPRVDVEGKVKVLKTLTDIYLASNKIRDKLMTDGVIHYDDHCRVCHKLGDLLCCETCPAVYHLACCDPPLTEVPDDEWQCEICVAHKLNGVYNCEPQHEFKGQYLRHDPIGTDRHGNKYWFLVRRIIVEGNDKVWYYSTAEQFQVLMTSLDRNKYETMLFEALEDIAGEFQKQVKVTQDLSEEALPDDKTMMYLSALKARVKNDLDEKRKKLEEEEEQRKKAEEEVKRKEDEERKKKELTEMKVMEIAEQKFETNEEAKPVITVKDEAPIADLTKNTEPPSEPMMDLLVKNEVPEIKEEAQTGDSVFDTSTPSNTAPQPSIPVSTQVLTPSNSSDVTIPTVAAPTPSVVTVPLASKVQGQTKPIQVIKLGANLPVKPIQQTNQPGTTTATTKPATPQLKTLYVLNKDGTKTQITLGPSGKLATANTQASGNRQILVLNSAKVALPKVNRELKKLQFTGAGPKIADPLSSPEAVKASGHQLRQRPQPPTSGQSSTDVKEPTLPPPPVIPKKKLTHEEEAELYFRLGEDKAYRQYVNHYTENTLALNKYQHKEERDRERYLSYKFSLSGEGEFKWIGDILGSEATMLETLRSTLMHFEHQIPLCFMHTKWDRYRNAWGKMVMTNSTPQGFAAALGILEMATRVVVKRSVWRNSHGLPRLKRVTVAEKEDWEKKRKHRTRAEEDEGNRNAVWCKYPFPIKCTLVWKVRGEEYRMTGYGGWIWISTTRQSKLRPYEPKPYTLVTEENKESANKSDSKPSSEPSVKSNPAAPEHDSDSEKSASTTSTTTTKSADLTEDRTVFETLVQEATKNEPNVASSASVTSSKESSMTSQDTKAEPDVSPSSSTTSPNESEVTSQESKADSNETPQSVTSSKESEVTSSPKEPGSAASIGDVTSTAMDQDVASSVATYDDIVNANDVINISENLLQHTAIYTKKWAASKVDILLGWRMVQKEKEEKSTKDKAPIASTGPSPTGTNSVTVTTNVKQPTAVTMATSTADSTPLTGTDSTKLGNVNVSPSASATNVASNASTNVSTSVNTSAQHGQESGLSDSARDVKMETNADAPPDGPNDEPRLDDITGLLIGLDAKQGDKDAVKTQPPDLHQDKELVTGTGTNLDGDDVVKTKTSIPNHHSELASGTGSNIGSGDGVETDKPKSNETGANEPPATVGPDESLVKMECDAATEKPDTNMTNHIGDDTTAMENEKSSDIVGNSLSDQSVPKDTNKDASAGTAVAAEDAIIDVMDSKDGTKLGDSIDSLVSTQDSSSVVDSVVKTTKTTISDCDQVVTVVETHTTTVTRTTTVTKTVTTVGATPVVKPDEVTEAIAPATSSTNGIPVTTDGISTSLGTTPSSVVSGVSGAATIGAKLLPQPIKESRPELVVSLPRIEFGKTGKASVVTQQVHTARLSRMSRARRVIRKARTGPLVETQKVWKLQRYRKSSVANKKEMKLPLPWKFCIGKQKKKSIFRLPLSAIRKVARRGGQHAYRAGFSFGAKWFSGLEQFWLYPCPRPTFSLTWRYKLQNATTFASVAHLLRTFWHALKWDKMTMRPQTDDVVHTVTTDDEIITTELLKRKDDLTTGLHSDYFIRRIRMPILDPEEEALRAIKPAEGYTPSRKGLRSSRRSSTLRNLPRKDSEPQVETVWVPEEQVELWQIRQFDTMLKQQQQNHSLPKTTSSTTTPSPNSVLHNGATTFIATSSGGILPTLQSIKPAKIESETSGPGFSIVRLPLHRNAQLLQKSTSNVQTTQGFLSTKTMLGRSPVQKIVVQPPQFSPFKQGDKTQPVIRSTAGGTQYIVQGGKLVKPIIIKAGSPIVTAPIQPKTAIRPNDQAIKFQQQPPLLPTVKKSPVNITPRTPPQQPQQQTQIKLSTAQLQQLLRVGSATPIRVSVSLGKGRTGVGQIQLIAPGSQVTPSAGQQLMQARVGGVVKKFLFTLISETSPTAATPVTPPSPANEVSLQTATLSQRLQQIHRQQLLGRNRNTDMKRLLTDKDPLWGSKPQSSERSSITPSPAEAERPKKKPLSRVQREEGQRQTVVAQVMKSILDRIEHKEKIELRNKKREEAILKQKERKEQSEQAKVLNRQTQFLHKHRDHLKQEILKRRAIVEKYLTHAVKNELREDQRKKHRGAGVTSPPSSKRPKKTFGNAIVTSAVLSENNEKRKQAAAKKRRISSPPPQQDAKKQKMINTKKKDTKLYCVCKTPYDPTKFYIGCDLCLNWFHGTCVGIPEERAKFMNEWICDECSQAKEEPAQELYCLCRTPYDDSKFYIGCDICQDWYHGECVGIAEKEAENIDFYSCPRCINKKKGATAAMEENLLSPEDHIELTKVIRSLRSHKMAWPFLQPVSKFEVPNYHKIIKKPMDLGTVMNKLPTYTMLSDLMSDVSLIFDNCRMFNGAESPLTRCAEIVESVFVGKMREYRGKRKGM